MPLNNIFKKVFYISAKLHLKMYLGYMFICIYNKYITFMLTSEIAKSGIFKVHPKRQNWNVCRLDLMESVYGRYWNVQATEFYPCGKINIIHGTTSKWYSHAELFPVNVLIFMIPLICKLTYQFIITFLSKSQISLFKKHFVLIVSNY
jgi:hypothetical protein